MKTVMVYMTAQDKAEARRIGAHLVKSKLAACVNILDGMNALYIWQGEFQDDREAVMIAKTTAEKVDRLVDAVKSRHSYECPCIVTLSIDGGNPAFIQWIDDQVAAS